MVVLSSTGEFYHYWPTEDKGKREFGYITVTQLSTEHRVAYVKREFTVYNQKSYEEVKLTHFHYTEWPESDPVPSATHGLLGLVEHAMAHQDQASLTGPIAVHCRYGSYRSSVYVVLSVLVQQMKKEGRCDVFTGVRKLRAQRQGMIQDLAQYEFVYRAISDYVDMYMNKDEEYEYSVPVGVGVAHHLNTGTSKSVKSIQSVKSVYSAKSQNSFKSNGSGPYTVPVGTTGSGGGTS
jgi:protein tyrosine phosphatase